MKTEGGWGGKRDDEHSREDDEREGWDGILGGEMLLKTGTRIYSILQTIEKDQRPCRSTRQKERKAAIEKRESTRRRG